MLPKILRFQALKGTDGYFYISRKSIAIQFSNFSSHPLLNVTEIFVGEVPQFVERIKAFFNSFDDSVVRFVVAEQVFSMIASFSLAYRLIYPFFECFNTFPSFQVWN